MVKGVGPGMRPYLLVQPFTHLVGGCLISQPRLSFALTLPKDIGVI